MKQGERSKQRGPGIIVGFYGIIIMAMAGHTSCARVYSYMYMYAYFSSFDSKRHHECTRGDSKLGIVTRLYKS